MAIYHLTTKFIKRSQGQSAVAKAAYNAHDLLKNDNDGKRHDYRHKGETAFSGIFISKDAPKWAHELAKDRGTLWGAVEKSETRKNSRLAKEIEIALPHELTDKQREYLVKDFVRENFMRKGLIADVSIHAPSKEGDARNHHAHILLTTREIGKEKFEKKLRDLDTRPQLLDWREKWGHLTNRHLERHGHQERVDHRTLEAQGIDREATIHLGPTATDYERDGVKTELGAVNEEIKNRNQQREHLKGLNKKIDRVLAQEARKKYLEKWRNEVLRLSTKSQTGHELITILESRGHMVARGAKDDFVILDPSGTPRPMAQTLKLSPEDLKKRLSDVDFQNVPDPEKAREKQKEILEKLALEKAASMYDRGGMASQQTAALFHNKDKQRAMLKRWRERQNEATTRKPRNGKAHTAQRQPEAQLDPLQRPQQQQKSKTQGEARREEKTARTEQTDRKQRKTAKDIQREAFEQGRRFRNSRDERERGDDGGRERER
ncbi:MAG TPA: hypothetical protein DD400_01080 [Rhodospirillaceae bacterium]|nr:hypothetical protein [Rhodospirillaceae bacterium]